MEFTPRGDDANPVQFETKQELFELQRLKDFAAMEGHYRFSCTYDPADRFGTREKTMIIAEQDFGYKWWVLGYVFDADISSWLPRWEAKYRVDETE